MFHRLTSTTRCFLLAAFVLILIGALWGRKGDAAIRALGITPVVHGEDVNTNCDEPDCPDEPRQDSFLSSLPGLMAPAPSPTATPKVTLTVPPEGFIGEDFKFTVTFENPQAGSVGFAPGIDLILDAGGADHNASPNTCDGIKIVSAQMIGINGGPVPIAPQTQAAPCGSPGFISHPFGGNPFGPVTVPTSAEMSTLVPPFGSFQSTQPTITIEVTARIHHHADLGHPLFIYARGFYRFGGDPLNNPTPDPPIFSDSSLTASAWNEKATIKPVLIIVNKTYKGAEQETATGPNFPHDYEIVVDIASGQTVTGLTVKDCLSPNMQYVALSPATTPGYTVISTPGLGQPCLELKYPSVLGIGGPEIKVVFSFFIPLKDPIGSILDPKSCQNATSIDTVSASADWTPLDVRDGTTSQNVQGKTVTDTITDKRIAIRKTVAVLPLPPGPLRPGKILRYNLDYDISDYFTVGGISLTDVLTDGQSLLTSGPYAPTLVINDRRGPPTNIPISIGSGITALPNPIVNCRGVKGGTSILFHVSQAMQNFPFPLGPRKLGILTGGHAFTPVSSVPATVRIVFYARIEDTFTYPQPGDKFVDKHDPMNNCLTGAGTIYTNHSTLPQPVVIPPSIFPLACGDDSSTSVALPGDVLEKKVFARNGSTTDPQLAYVPPRFTAADTITFRISKTLPAGDYEKLTIRDWFPLPVLSTAGLILDTAVCPTGLPAAGHICRGPGHTLAVVPTLALNAADNSMTLDYGTHDETSNLPKTIELYITLTISADPYADGLHLTNEAQECEFNTFKIQFCQTAIARFQLTEPNIRIRKGVIKTNNPFGIFSSPPPVPPGITNVLQFTNAAGSCGLPGACPRIWTPGIVNSTMLSNPNALNSDLIADAHDWVTFGIVVENLGSGINGAYDIKFKDTPHTPGFVSPAFSYNLRAHNGIGNQINLTPPGFFQLMTPLGKEMMDTALGALAPYSPTNGRNLAIITYNMQLAGNGVVQIGACYKNTAELINYAAVNNGPNFVTAGFTPPFTDSAKVCITPTLEKSLVATSEPHTTPQTSATGIPKLAIGEIARYQLRVQLPEGIGPNFQVTDALPGGMKFMNDGSARLAFISNGAGISHPAITGAGFDVAGNQSIFPFSPPQQVTSGISVGPICGDDPVFNLGQIQNNDNDTDAEFVVIEFNALVCNEPGNTSPTTTLSDTFSVSVAGNPIATSNQVNAIVAEPKLNLVKTAVPATVAPGGILTFNVSVTNGGTADAFDVQITDPMGSGSGLLPMGPVTFTSSCVAAVPTLIAGVISVPRLPVGCTIAATLMARVTFKCPVASVTNTAFATYTSLPAGASNPTGSVTPGPSGAINGERQYSDSGSVTVPLICVNTASCASPPPNMVAWYPLDEQNGATTVVDIAGGHTGMQRTSGSPAPLAHAQPGKVLGSLWISFNHVDVPDTPALKLGTGNMSIDAWINNGEPGLIVSVVDKLDIAAKKGYALYIQANRLKFVMGNGAAFTTYTSTNQVGLIFGVPAWHHVAVTVDRSAGIGTFYVDGAPAGTFAPLAGTIDISSTSSLLLGGSRLSFTPNNPCVCEFNIDEIEIFNDVVKASDIQAIFAAGAIGKCRTGSLTVSKVIKSQPHPVFSPPAGTLFPVTVACLPSGPNSTFNLSAGSPSQTLTNISPGSTCTVTEGPLPPPGPHPACLLIGWTLPVYNPAQTAVITPVNLFQTIVIENTYKCSP